MKTEVIRTGVCRIMVASVSASLIGWATFKLALPMWAVTGIVAGVASAVYIAQRGFWYQIFVSDEQ
ncbi:hypothetical protein R75461_07254 [Paraburkholderia nemoris]|uniref:hypothetical protein n=1 Tax=Paraburkholderia nemoris TaxID=2793076 RepID=UPI00190AF634|nr:MULTISPECIES: hypothetical protein [Paraburkholderia]MBK3786091.1 hypothetical protein [Paraburkholderia aspalathi]CAE6846211.1 hypothetical protein R75461_07254 [Paraburkholderia nemoris]